MRDDRRGEARSKTGNVALMAFLVIAVMVASGTFASVGAEGSEETRSSLPDLAIKALYNYTEVITGELTWFNLTIWNLGDAAYLWRTSGDLEIHGYRDSETQVAFFERVYDDLYVNQNLTMDIQVQFDTLGTHSLTIVIDEMNRVSEGDEKNNRATIEFEAVNSQQNRPPKADGGNDRTGTRGIPMLFSAEYSSDPDDDTLTYTWDFGDGTIESGVRLHHTYSDLGDFRVVLTVSDGVLFDQDIFTVHMVDTPSNLPPVARISVAVTQVLVNKAITMDGTGSSDPDGDLLQYDWDFDATNGVDDWVRGPAVVISWENDGIYTVTLRVTDGVESDTATKQITVTAPQPPNKPPSAEAGLDIVLSKGKGWTFSGSGSDPDGSIAAYEWDMDGDGTYDTYNEADGTLSLKFDESGYVTLWLRVTDDDGATAVDSVVVTVKEIENGKGSTPGLPSIAVIATLLGAAFIARRGKK
jgi:PKD repeat protein